MIMVVALCVVDYVGIDVVIVVCVRVVAVCDATVVVGCVVFVDVVMCGVYVIVDNTVFVMMVVWVYHSERC